MGRHVYISATYEACALKLCSMQSGTATETTKGDSYKLTLAYPNQSHTKTWHYELK